MRHITLALMALVASTAALAADKQTPFAFSPQPRWQMGPDQEPETEQVCAAVRKECPGIKDVTDINVEFGYDQIFDADGQLVGLRMTKSTGCKPLDESMLLSRRKFKMAFHQDGQSDLDGNIHAEVSAGVARDGVRIVKSDSTSLSMGCNPG